jgi:diguanylate cyclase (GGDEF)-like protein
VLNGDFTKDSLTGFLNIFGLIESINTGQLEEKGTICIYHLDFKQLAKEEIYLKTLGDTFKALYKESDPKVIPFRMGDYEFLLIYPGSSGLKTVEQTNLFKKVFIQKIREQSLLPLDMKESIITYGEEGKQLSALLQSIFFSQINMEPVMEDNHFLPGLKWLISNLTEHICQAYRLFSQVQNLALNDEVSGLPNQRAARYVMRKKFNHSQAEQEPFSILFIDGDNLKQYNTLGYQRGNLMIRDLGKLMADQLRREDFLARWFSGDEFLVILPKADRMEALRVGERLRSKVEKTTRKWPFPITISVGVATYPLDGSTMEELLVKAEKANALAKKEGKNKVCEAKASF